MAFVVVAVLTTIVVGIPVTLAIDGRARGAALVGLSYLYGAGVVWAALLALSLLHIRWSSISATVAMIVCSGAVWLVARRRGVMPRPAEVASPPGEVRVFRLAFIVDVLTIYTIACYALYATLARVWEWDFWAIWGLKARVFVEASGVDWAFLRSPFNDFAHPDYPLLVPLNYAWAALVNGGWDDRWLGLIGVAFAVATLLIVRSLSTREAGDVGSAVLTFAATAFVLSRYVGLAEAPFIAYATAAVLFLRKGILDDDRIARRHGAILLGLAASTKIEGFALIVSVAIAAVVFGLLQGRKRSSRDGEESQDATAASGAMNAIFGLWPAVVIIAPWLVTKTVLHLTNDVTRGSFFSRFFERLAVAPQIMAWLVEWLPDPAMWVLLMAGLLLTIRRDGRREAFVLTVVMTQLLLYIIAYFGTPRDVQWHIETSWPRLARHAATPLLFVVMLALARNFSRGETLAHHAEARSELS